MALKNVLVSLNSLKKEGVIQDYAIAGGYAAVFYDIPMTTYDLDVLVVLPSEDDFHKLYEYFRSRGARIENVYIFIGDMPIQFLPNYISPLFDSAVKEAITVDFDGVESRFVSVEHLILLLLTAFRDKDRIRIQRLLGKANRDSLPGLIKRFDDDKNKLYERYKEILART